MNLNTHDTLVTHLLELLPDARRVETHISSVLLSGEVAYKIKKPVNFGFLDYGTLEKRRRCCEEEFRSNRRFAPQLYLDVVAIAGTPEHPQMGGEGEAIEYAVKMRRFRQEDQLDHRFEGEGLAPETADALAAVIADFHQRAEPVGAGEAYGDPERVVAPMLENFELMEGLKDARLERLKRRTLEEFETLKPLLERRKAEGYVRECHGDMHLHNIAFFEGTLILFDAIEFNPFLSHIDVISDLAFLLMDLEERGEVRFASRLLNAYLERTGDYGGVALLEFYKRYRAMVRAKVEMLQALQHPEGAQRELGLKAVEAYIALAEGYGRRQAPFLAITMGASGSGKSAAALEAAETFGALRLRSDAERMRRFDGREERYGGAATQQTYARLLELSAMLLQNGYGVIADATFLKRARRDPFAQLAEERGVRFVILEMACDAATMRRRLAERAEAGRDISEADAGVMERQLDGAEPLGGGEGCCSRRISCESPERMARDVREALS